MSALYDCQNPRCVDGDAYRAEVSRLQARWDARNEALHTLTKKWRAESETDRAAASAASDLDRAMYAGGRAVAAMGHADELERTMEGGRG